MTRNPEEDLAIANHNAQETLQRIQCQVPKRLEVREDTVPERMRRHKGNAFTKLKALYDEMAPLENVIARNTPCSAGCSACCYIPVSVSELEASYIERHTGRKATREVSSQSGHDTACPFLKNHRCSIYEVRPYACRRHTTLAKTNYWCQPERCDTVRLPLMRFSGWDAAFSELLASSGAGKLRDIRAWFAAAPAPKGRMSSKER